ncbi:S9 family peptidase [Corynebacterium xerosis]|uniref:S9 family peptidase n=1 Tax=Corynebacterium xerosis TaxID=1725 RepID=A0ABV3USC1_9CORY|nr:S9 family peptidase [Corynebacterium xerosis]KKO82166.1 protease 2 [Corynebacterium xerosis]SQB96014.1 Protease 2 [Clostridium paraputrificum]
MAAPIAARRPHVRAHHGREFVDDYEWLRDKTDPEVIAHLNAENAYTDAMTADLGDLSEAIFGEIKSRVQETDMSVPVRSGDWWYYSRTLEGKSYGLSCRMRADGDDWTPPAIPDAAPGEPVPGEEILLDLNELAEGHEFFSLGAASVTVDGNLLAYSVDVVGDERYTLRIKDLRTGELYDDVIADISAGATWVGSDHLFYQRLDEAWRPDSVWRHTVGKPASEDVRVFHEPDEAYWVGVGTTRSEKYLIFEAGSKITSETWYLECSDPTGEPVCVRPRERGVEYDVDHAVIGGQDVWLVTHNMTGPNFALGAVPVGTFDSFDDLRELVAHDPKVRVEGIDCFAGHLVLAYRSGGIGRLALSVLDGSPLDDGAVEFSELEFPEELYTAASAGNPEWEAPVLRFSYGSFTTPTEVWQLDVATGERELLKRQPVRGGYEPSDYVATRRWVEARDGALVPVSLVHRADLDVTRPNPLLLYGYGSYEAPIDPGFSVARLSLMDRGMIFAIAHVRGGGEMGRAWWEQGRGLTKKNTFTDFIDVADDLLAAGLTTRDQMVADGGSAGGMLMGAVANMAGDRFAGIEAVVPFVDPLTSMLMPELPLTVVEWDEWGDPFHEEEVYDYMASYAPYENIEAKKYPQILAVTSLNDTRVLYVEPAKWIAKLREVAGGEEGGTNGPFLLKTEMSAGHGGVSGRYAKWRETAFQYAWLLRVAGAA